MTDTQTDWIDEELKYLKFMWRHHWRHEEYYRKNHERLLNQVREYRKNNSQRVKESSKKYYEANKNKWNDYTIKKYHCDIEFKIKMNIRNRIRKALNGQKIKKDEFGIDYKKIIDYLKPFPEDIQNYHIDHIIPICSFNLNKREEIIRAFAPENHRWLLAKENLQKSHKDKLQSIKLKNGGKS